MWGPRSQTEEGDVDTLVHLSSASRRRKQKWPRAKEVDDLTQLMLYPADNLSTSSSHYYGGWREGRAEIKLSTRVAPVSIKVNCECSEKNIVLL